MSNAKRCGRVAPHAVIGALALATLVGCAGDQPRNPACPSVGVLSEAATLTSFAPGTGRDLVDVDHEAEIVDVSSGCTYEGDPGDSDRVLIVAVAPSIEASRGPANETREAVFDYFVSVVDASGNVRSKQRFSVGVRFEGNRTRIRFRDDDPPVTVNIPAPTDSAVAGTKILVGFQLSAEQLEYNRRQQRATR